MTKSKNIYSLQIKNIRCPIDSQLINYKAKMCSPKTIFVEDILIFINEIKKKPLFQEDLTKLLYNKFNLKYIKLSGTHSKIKIKSTIEK